MRLEPFAAFAAIASREPLIDTPEENAMKNAVSAITAALVLGACATPNANNGAAASTAAGTQYCWQDRLSNSGGKLTCNWAGDKRSACEGAEFTTVDAARVSAPRKSSMCSNGQWLVEVSRG